jgi:Tfp pilus assembly protein PilF
VATHPDDPKSHSVYGDFLLQDNKIAEARDQFVMAAKLDSTKYIIWEEILQLDARLLNFKDLAETGSTVVELFPEQPLPYLFSGIGMYQLKDYEKALRMLNTGSKLVVNNDYLEAQFFMYMGDTYHALKRADESDKAYEKSLALYDSNAYVLNNYSYYLSIRNQNLAKAETMAKKAVTLEPENPSFQDTYGWVLYKLGKYEDAKTWVNKSIESKEVPSGEVLEHYGDILYKLGDTGQALEYWKKAAQKGGASEFIDKKITEKKLYE